MRLIKMLIVIFIGLTPGGFTSATAGSLKTITVECFENGVGALLVDGPQFQKILNAIGRPNAQCKNMKRITRHKVNDEGMDGTCKCYL